MSDYTPLDDKDVQRFWGYVDKKGKDECWEWTGLKFGSGYGLIRIKRKNRRTHRIAWELIHGDIPGGMYICHRCDNPPCCNPNHLFLGTSTDNARDRNSKGRHFVYKGEQHYKHKLTRKQVEEIREKYARGGTSHRLLGIEYGVAAGTITNILSRRNWK